MSTRAGRSKVTVSLEGAFFTHDPYKTFEGNVTDALEQLAEWGEAEVRTQIESHSGQMKHYTGFSARRVRGRVASTSGKPWHRHAVVSAFTGDLGAKEAIRTKASSASIERRWRPYGRVARGARLVRPVLTANLVRGLE